MFGLGKRKRDEEEEVDCCRLCVYARTDGDGTFFCKKKNKAVSEEDSCKTFEYDLLKKDPAARPSFAGLGELFGEDESENGTESGKDKEGK